MRGIFIPECTQEEIGEILMYARIGANNSMIGVHKHYISVEDTELRPQEAEWIIDTITRNTICSRCRQSRRDTRTQHIYYCNHCGARMINASEVIT